MKKSYVMIDAIDSRGAAVSIRFESVSCNPKIMQLTKQRDKEALDAVWQHGYDVGTHAGIQTGKAQLLNEWRDNT